MTQAGIKGSKLKIEVGLEAKNLLKLQKLAVISDRLASSEALEGELKHDRKH